MKFLLLFFIPFSAQCFLPKGFKANFVEEHKSSISGKLKMSSGVLNYKYPGKFKLEVQKPDAQTLVSNGMTLWRYNPPFIEGEQGNVSISSVGEKSFMRFFDILKAGLKNNKNYKVKKLKSNSYQLNFSKRSVKDLGIVKIELQFGKGVNFSSLRSMKIFEYKSKPRLFKFKDITLMDKLSDSIFNFKVPDQTRVHYMSDSKNPSSK